MTDAGPGRAALLLTLGVAGNGGVCQHRILSASVGASLLLGHTPDALLGSDLRAVLCDEHDPAAWEALERQLDVQQEACALLLVKPSSGASSGDEATTESRWLDVTVTALPGGRYAWACAASAGPIDLSEVPQPLTPLPEMDAGAAAALRALPQPVWVCDEAGRVVFANPPFCRLAACDEHAASAGHAWTQLLQLAAGDTQAAAQLSAAMADGENGQADLSCGRVSVSPLGPSSGAAPCSGDAPLLLVCTLLPGPPPAIAPPAAGGGEAVSAPLAQLCNQALASTSESVAITDPTQPGNPIIYANSAFERLTGYSQSAVLGRGHSFLQGPDTDPVVLADIAAALDEGRPIVAELLVYRADGAPFWSQVSITPIPDAADPARVANYVMVQRDVSQRKAAEAAFHIREQALSNLNQGVTICDPTIKDCPVVYCNSAFLRITGYSRREVIGRNCRFLQGPKTDMATVQRLATALHEGRELTVELLNYRKDGEEFYNMLSITPVRDAAGRLLSFIGVQSDVTELTLRRQAEKELQEAKAAAETAAEAKSMFLANMSHEIRTPLNGMIAVAQMLLSSGLSPEQRELGDMILESGNTLLTILGDILDFSKIDHNSMVLESAPLALRDTIEASIEMVAADAARKGLDVAYSLEAPLVCRRLLGDSIRIRQVLANLLSNAVKFTSTGEVVVDAWVDEQPAALAHAAPASPASSQEEGPAGKQGAVGSPAVLHMTVRDTGIGISHESISRLFQCFRQANESMSRRYGGTGLGLAISRRLSQLMGGDVWVESVEGQGSTFHFVMALQWEGEAGGLDADSRRASASSEPATRCSVSSMDSPLAAAAAPGAAALARAGGDSCGGSSGGSGSGQRAEEQRLLLQQHHEALLLKLVQGSVPAAERQRAAASSAALAAELPPGASLRTSEGTDAPDTPSTHLPLRLGARSVSAVSSSNLLASLTSSSKSLPSLSAMAGAAATHSLCGAAAQGSASRRSSSSSDGTLPAQRGSTDNGCFTPASSRRGSHESSDLSRPPRPPPPAPTSDYRLSSFYSSGQPPVKPQATASGPAAAAGAAAGVAAAAAKQQQQQQQQRPRPSAVGRAPEQATVPTRPGSARAAPADARRGSADGGASTSSAPPASNAAQAAAAPPARGSASASADTRLAGGAEAAPLRSRSVCIDVAHGPTAAQVAQSCTQLGMEVVLQPCSAPLPPAAGQAEGADGGACSAPQRDFCITTPDKALEALRAGWRGHPLVVLGRREDLPLNLQAMTTTVSKPVKHTRLLCGLLKAAAFARSKQQAPLHSSPQMLSLLPERLSLNRLAVNRRMSLDNSVLDRRRWQLMAAATAAAAEPPPAAPVSQNPNSQSPPPPVVVLRSSAPTDDVAAPYSGGRLHRRGLSCDDGLPASLQSLHLESRGRAQVDSAADGCWRPQLPAIPSTSGGSSSRSSLEMPEGRGAAAEEADVARLRQAGAVLADGAGPAPPAAAQLATALPAAGTTAAASLSSHSSLGAAQQPAAAPLGCSTAGTSSPRPPHILVAEDNLINQRVISKVLQRVVPLATVTVVGNGALAVQAATCQPYDLCLMDIHMPEMDGLEASRLLQSQLRPQQRPLVVALSADTLQVLHDKCKLAGIREFICKPFRIEDVQRVLTMIAPRLLHPLGTVPAPPPPPPA